MNHQADDADIAAAQSHRERPFPIPVRHLHYEMPRSYFRRSCEANFLPMNMARYLIRKTREANVGMTQDQALCRIAERTGGLDEGYFARLAAYGGSHPGGVRCNRCQTGSGARYMCRLCAHGSLVEQFPFLLPNVCISHRLWVAQGTRPAAQFVVEDVVVQAELTRHKLVASGRLDAPLEAVLIAAFRTGGQDRPTTKELAVSRAYPLMMRVARAITSVKFVRAFLAPGEATNTSLDYFTTTVATAVGMVSCRVDLLWEFFQPMCRRINADLRLHPQTMRWTGHDYGITPSLWGCWAESTRSSQLEGNPLPARASLR